MTLTVLQPLKICKILRLIFLKNSKLMGITKMTYQICLIFQRFGKQIRADFPFWNGQSLFIGVMGWFCISINHCCVQLLIIDWFILISLNFFHLTNKHCAVVMFWSLFFDELNVLCFNSLWTQTNFDFQFALYFQMCF